ncbi:transposase [Synechococcus sp. BSF8S]|uniref:transposase n=1 Tax=Synechococcales TaxID=1890424 RepID=UPI00351C861F
MLLLYAYCVGIVPSRKIERACYEDLAFRVLTSNQQPDHSRISEFRRRNWGSPDSVDTDQGFTGVSVEVAMNLCSQSIGLR